MLVFGAKIWTNNNEIIDGKWSTSLPASDVVQLDPKIKLDKSLPVGTTGGGKSKRVKRRSSRRNR